MSKTEKNRENQRISKEYMQKQETDEFALFR